MDWNFFWENFFIIIISILSLIGGFIAGILYEEKGTYVRVDGLWVNDMTALSKYEGKFICVNIDTVKDLRRLNEIVAHEVGHEIFAQICEKNITKCEGITNGRESSN